MRESPPDDQVWYIIRLNLHKKTGRAGRPDFVNIVSVSVRLTSQKSRDFDFFLFGAHLFLALGS